MSECVVRMEMPSCCHDCPFEADQWDYPICRVTGRSEGYRFDARNNRMVDCPIICQLPEGHGRLVDADELSKYWKCRIALMNSCSGKRGILESVEASTIKSCIEDMGNAKTIVPAEAERSET